MISCLSIDPNAIYDEGSVSLSLDIPLATLGRARREGKLRYSRKGRRVFYLGRWLLAWFDADASTAPQEACHA